MTEADRPGFVRVLVGLGAIKPSMKLTTEAIELWWNAMADWSLSDFKAAASHLVKTCEFITPKEFEDLRKAGRKTPGEAWGELLEFVRSSRYRIRNHHDPAIHRAACAIGGYGKIALAMHDELGFLERRFTTHYVEIRDAVDTRIALQTIAAPNVDNVVPLPDLRAGR